MSPESEGLRARIRQLRHDLAPSDVASPSRTELSSGPDGIAGLQARVAHLEQMVQGLQDSVYRESHRQERRIAELEMRIEPTALAAALSKDARERGI